MQRNDGFTLVELVLVLLLIGIAATMATLNLSRIYQKSQEESEIREIHTILMRAKNDATRTNTTHLVTLAARKIQTGIDNDNDGTIDESLHSWTFSKFTINHTNNATISFNRRGLSSINTIYLTGYSSKVNPVIDCIDLSSTRINMGKYTSGAECEPQ